MYIIPHNSFLYRINPHSSIFTLQMFFTCGTSYVTIIFCMCTFKTNLIQTEFGLIALQQGTDVTEHILHMTSSTSVFMR